jgi:ribose transport system substrate-binding protein
MATVDTGTQRRGGGAALPALALLLAFGLLGAACGSSNTGSSGTAKKYSIGVVLFSAADTSSMTMVDPFVAAAKSAGYTVQLVDSQGAPDKAVAAIQDFVTKKVDMIFVPVWEPTQITAGAMAAKAAGIPIVGMGGGLGTGVEAVWDNATQAGQLAAQRIIQDSGGKGQLLVISYTPGRPCRVREAQLMDALKSTSITVDRQELQVPDIIGSAKQLTNAFLAKHPQGTQGLMAWLCADSILPGSLAAMRSAGRNDVKIYSMGGEPPAIKALQTGELSVDVYVAMNAAGIELAQNVSTIISNGVDGKTTLSKSVGGTVLDASNIQQFLKDHPELAV